MSDKQTMLAAALHELQNAPVITANHAERLAIFGGQFAPTDLERFLDAWESCWDGMPWRVWEYVHGIEFTDDTANHKYLQRAEVFGTGGHLSLRRDGNRWLWHYIGPADQSAPTGFEHPDVCADFWTSPEGQTAQLRRYAEYALLWGAEIVDLQTEQPTGRWWEDRVAGASLCYPDQLTGHSRVQLHFWHFTEGGKTAFVWYRGLEQATDVDAAMSMHEQGEAQIEDQGATQ
jgi:hypothetical protein